MGWPERGHVPKLREGPTRCRPRVVPPTTAGCSNHSQSWTVVIARGTPARPSVTTTVTGARSCGAAARARSMSRPSRPRTPTGEGQKQLSGALMIALDIGPSQVPVRHVARGCLRALEELCTSSPSACSGFDSSCASVAEARSIPCTRNSVIFLATASLLVPYRLPPEVPGLFRVYEQAPERDRLRIHPCRAERGGSPAPLQCGRRSGSRGWPKADALLQPLSEGSHRGYGGCGNTPFGLH